MGAKRSSGGADPRSLPGPACSIIDEERPSFDGRPRLVRNRLVVWYRLFRLSKAGGDAKAQPGQQSALAGLLLAGPVPRLSALERGSHFTTDQVQRPRRQ